MRPAHFFHTIATVAIMVLLPLQASGQQAIPSSTQVNAQVDPKVAGVGHEASYSIIVNATRNISTFPQSIVVDGLDISPPSTNQYQGNVNGQSFTQLRLIYPIVPARTGTFTIPPQTVVADGKQFLTPPVTLTVKDGAQVRSPFDPFVKINTAKTELWAGELTQLDISLYVHRDTNLLNLPLPEITHPNFVIKRPERPDRNLTELDGEQYIVYSYRTSLQAIQPGEFEIEPAKINVSVSFPDSRGGPSSFSGFFRRSVNRKFVLSSNSLELKINALPHEGRPDTFGGLVGSFRFTSTAKPTTLNEGDPIALDVAISGSGNFDAVSAPVLTDSDGWRLYPPSTTQENRSLGLEPGIVRFSQVIIPEQMHETVPPLEFSYFDPDKGSYQILTSRAIPLKMSPDPGARLPVESTTYAASTLSTAASTPDEKMGDILDILQPATVAWAAPLPSLTSSPVFWAAQVVPASALIGFFVLGLRQRGRQRKLLKSHTAPERSAEVVLAELISDSPPPARFFQLVSEFYTRSGSVPSIPDALALKEKADRITYGAAPAPTSLSDSERQDTLKTLSQ